MNRLRITPIGTCRIHTPLRRGALRSPVELDLNRNFGFVHTSAEALQLVQFLQGEKQFRDEVVPLVIRDGDLATVDAEQWRPADLHIVEISSSKLIRSGAESVQANYIGHHFADFFANRERSQRFWTLARKGDRRDVLDYLRATPAFERLTGADRQLLASLSVEQQSSSALRSDMTEIVDRLGRDKVLFVTHVNALTPDDNPIPQRARLVRLVKLMAEELGVPVFDPTPVMQQAGQSHALENEGADLTHYTAAFSDLVYGALHREHLAALIGDEAAAATAVDPGDAAAERLIRAMETSEFEKASRAIHAAAREHPGSLALTQLRGQVRARAGDFDGAASDLSVVDEALLAHPARMALMEALFETGRPAEAVAVAEALLGDEFESATIYRVASAAAEQAGDADKATAFAKQMFRQDRSNLQAGLHALTLIVRHGSADEAGEWRAEVLESISGASTGAFELCLWAIEQRDDELFSAALAVIGANDKAATIDLLDAAAQCGMVRGVADSTAVAVSLGRLDRNLAKRRLDTLGWAVDEAGRLLEREQVVDSYHAANALSQLDHTDNSQLRKTRFGREAVRLMRAAERQVRLSIREAFAKGEHERVIELGQYAMEILTNDPDAALLVVRAMHSAGKTSKGLALLRKVLVVHPDHFSLRRWGARLAALADDHATALDMYAGLDRADPRFAQVRPELDRYMASANNRALRELRQLIDQERFDAALHLAGAISSHLGWGERQEREITRMYRVLRTRLREIEETTGELEEREPILRYMTLIRPNDAVALRRLALEFMRQFRFDEAAECWAQLTAIAPDNETAVRNQQRCRILAARKSGLAMTEAAA